MRRFLRKLRFVLRHEADNAFQADLDRLREERAHSLFLAQKGLDKR